MPGRVREYPPGQGLLFCWFVGEQRVIPSGIVKVKVVPSCEGRSLMYPDCVFCAVNLIVLPDLLKLEPLMVILELTVALGGISWLIVGGIPSCGEGGVVLIMMELGKADGCVVVEADSVLFILKKLRITKVPMDMSAKMTKLQIIVVFILISIEQSCF